MSTPMVVEWMTTVAAKTIDLAHVQDISFITFSGVVP